MMLFQLCKIVSKSMTILIEKVDIMWNGQALLFHLTLHTCNVQYNVQNSKYHIYLLLCSPHF
jgi:hypothetical protein